MIKRFFLSVIFIIIFPLSLMGADYLQEADKIFNKGGLENYKKSIDIYIKAVEANPNSFDANWKLSRAYRYYAHIIRNQQDKGWKDICAINGKQGMKFGQKAIELEPDKPQGYYYFGLNAGTYSDGVSILTAIKEGLLKKTK